MPKSAVPPTDSDGRQTSRSSSSAFEAALERVRRLVDGDPPAALEAARNLVASTPEPAAFRLLAAALRRLGLGRQAEAAEVRALQASGRVPELSQATSALAQQRSADAQSILETYLRDHPDDLLALYLAGEAALVRRDYATAARLARQVIERAPPFLAASILLAKTFVEQSSITDAIEVIEAIHGRSPNDAGVSCYFAQVLTEIGRHDRAAAIYKELLAANPAARDIWILYADTLRFIGRSTDSKAALRRALALDPFRGPAWWSLANHFPSSLKDADWEQVRAGIDERKAMPDDACLLHIALSIGLDRERRFGEAFEHIAAGKRLARQAQPYDPARTTFEVRKWTNSDPDISNAAGSGYTDRAPIFIVGMPRSGSTLVERILGRHSKIEAAGELPVLPRLVDSLHGQMAEAESLQEAVASMSPAECVGLGQRYIEGTRDYRHSDKPRFVDKLHMNWLHSGLIRRTLPNAKIIDVRRNALDCCWSNFRQIFTAKHPAANDLRHIGRWYADYVRLMDWLEKAAPGAVLRVRYEDVVIDVDGATRRILDFIGEELEPGITDFHLTREPVATLSSEQVRRPLNREGLGVSLPYRPWLQPLIEELGPLANG